MKKRNAIMLWIAVIFAATFDDGIRVMDAANQDKIILIREPRRIISMSVQN